MEKLNMGTKYNIIDIGTAEVDKKWMKANFSISYNQFVDKFGDLIEDYLPKDDIEKAIDSPGEEIKIDKKSRDRLEEFFEKVAAKAEEMSSGTKMGFNADERSESATSESMKSRSSQTSTISYQDNDPSTAGIETYDARTGAKEGQIVLGEDGATGELVPLEIIEKVEAHFEFNADEDIEEDRKTSGQFKITNPSESHKIWDIDVNFNKEGSASIDEDIHINNLEPQGEQIIDYEIEEFEEPALNVKEFISTLNDEEINSYSLSTSASNVVLFMITAKNTKDYDLIDVKVTKNIQEGYMGVDVLDTSLGVAEATADNTIEWTIEKLEAGAEAVLKINMTIEVSSAEEKARTGTIAAEYFANKAITGIEIDKFDAYSDNFVGIMEEQQDEDPDKYTCSVWFQNESDFQMQLVNLDVVESESQDKVIDIDPNDIPLIASGATWKSVEWVSETEDGMEPEFQKTVEFFLVSKRKISTLGSLTFDDIELAVAIMAGKLDYSATSIQSYRIVPFDALHQVKNTGGADLNELVIEETIQSGYIPPKAEEIELYIVRPSEDSDTSEGFDVDEEIEWEELGEQISIDESMIEITPNDQEPDTEHIVRINLTELRDNAIGMFIPGMVIKAKYPITAYKVAKDTEYVANVKYLGNTYPAGAPLEISPIEEPRIPVVHMRKRILKGKKVSAMATDGHYEITLTLRNTGADALENIEIKDMVPENFEYADYSLEPVKFDNLEGKDVLIWNIEKIEAEETYTITYKITGTGDEYRASGAQVSM